MSARTMIVVGLALVCGLCAAVGIQGMKKTPAKAQAAEAAKVAMESVVVAVIPITQGHILEATDIALHELPKEFVPTGSLSQVSSAIGRRAMIPMVKGDTVTDRMLVAPGGSGLAPRVDPGWRAFTIPATGPSASLAGALSTGDRVDVLFTRGNQGGGGSMTGARAITLLQNVEVLVVNHKDESAATNKLGASEVVSTTLRVMPQDAAVLDQALAQGILHLSLRNPGDKTLAAPSDSLADGIELGKRAFTIQTRNLSANLAGFLLPGDRVDVFHSPKYIGGAASSSQTKTILEMIKVLAVHTRTELPAGNQIEPTEAVSVTLLVDPKQAEQLEHAQNTGTLGLALRHPKDGAKTERTPTALSLESTEHTRTLRGTRYGSDRFTTRSSNRP